MFMTPQNFEDAARRYAETHGVGESDGKTKFAQILGFDHADHARQALGAAAAQAPVDAEIDADQSDDDGERRSPLGFWL